MADSTFGFKLGVEGEKEFKQALSGINQQFKVLGSEMTLVTSQFGKQTGRTVTYSVNTYISSMQDVTNEPLQMLVRALYCYGASAKAYAGK